MLISKDFSYISPAKSRLVDVGCGKYTVYSLHFDRHISEEQRQSNIEFFRDMTDEQRVEYYNSSEFEAVQADFSKALEEVINFLDGKFNIHQTTTENSTMKHYKSDWDMFFWCDRGWNNSSYMSHFSLTFNQERTPEQNMALLEKIIPMLESMENEQVFCRVQYDIGIDMEKAAEAAKKSFDGINGKFVEMFGCIGKIKVVSSDTDGIRYGFFKKGAKSKYYPLSYADLISTAL